MRFSSLSLFSRLQYRPTYCSSANTILNCKMSSLTKSPDIAQPDFLLAEEPISEYRTGGYHPTNIGDIFNSRYKVCRKLGWGRYSTVWLARDMETNHFASIKILTGVSSDASGSQLHELEFLQHTSKFDPSHPGYSRIIRLLDHFHHRGPYGNHLCLVTDVMGESIASYKTYYIGYRIHPAVVKGIVQQVLQGVEYLHKSGIVHTDLKMDNFLIEMDDMDAYVQRALNSSEAEIFPDIRAADGTSINYVASTPLAVPEDVYKNFKPLKVKIADLGVSCWEDKVANHFTDQVQPVALRAPEVYIGAGWDSKCDIWSLCLLTYEMLLGRSLIDTDEAKTMSFKVFLLVSYFGNLSPDLLERGKYSQRYFKSDGSFIYDLSDIIDNIPRATKYLEIYNNFLYPDEMQRLISFLEAASALRPEDRPTAAQLLDHDWIKSETVVQQQR